MNKIIFTDKTELTALRVEEGPTFFDNANRRMLTVEVSAGEGLERVNELLSNPDNLQQIKHLNTAVPIPKLDKDGNPERDKAGELIFEMTEAADMFMNYQIKKSLSLKPIEIGVSEDGTPISEDRIVFELARYTPIELQLIQLGIKL